MLYQLSYRGSCRACAHIARNSGLKSAEFRRGPWTRFAAVAPMRRRPLRSRRARRQFRAMLDLDRLPGIADARPDGRGRSPDDRGGNAGHRADGAGRRARSPTRRCALRARRGASPFSAVPAIMAATASSRRGCCASAAIASASRLLGDRADLRGDAALAAARWQGAVAPAGRSRPRRRRSRHRRAVRSRPRARPRRARRATCVERINHSARRDVRSWRSIFPPGSTARPARCAARRCRRPPASRSFA